MSGTRLGVKESERLRLPGVFEQFLGKRRDGIQTHGLILVHRRVDDRDAVDARVVRLPLSQRSLLNRESVGDDREHALKAVAQLQLGARRFWKRLGKPHAAIEHGDGLAVVRDQRIVRGIVAVGEAEDRGFGRELALASEQSLSRGKKLARAIGEYGQRAFRNFHHSRDLAQRLAKGLGHPDGRRHVRGVDRNRLGDDPRRRF